jgi:hypothetical protein
MWYEFCLNSYCIGMFFTFHGTCTHAQLAFNETRHRICGLPYGEKSASFASFAAVVGAICVVNFFVLAESFCRSLHIPKCSKTV